MDFIYLFCNKGGKLPKWTQAEMEAQMLEGNNWTEKLSEEGHFQGGEAMESSGKVVHCPDNTVSDGPYAAASDILSSYLMVFAQDIDEAVELS